MDELLIEEYFNDIKNYLLDKNNRKIYIHERNQCHETNSGVYCFFIDNKVSYIGETGCLKKRINDLLNTRNHTFRRIFGELYFSSHTLYSKASSTNGYHKEIENLLVGKMKKHLSYSYKSMNIGRKEFEEWFQENCNEFEFLNKRKKRR